MLSLWASGAHHSNRDTKAEQTETNTRENKQIFKDLRDNSFSVPKKRDFSSTMMKKCLTISTANESCSTEEETIESPQKVTHIKNEEFVHYTNILPASDKKTEAINTLIGIFYNFLL